MKRIAAIAIAVLAAYALGTLSGCGPASQGEPLSVAVVYLRMSSRIFFQGTVGERFSCFENSIAS